MITGAIRMEILRFALVVTLVSTVGLSLAVLLVVTADDAVAPSEINTTNDQR